MPEGDLNTFLHCARASALSPSTSNSSGDLAVSVDDDTVNEENVDDEIESDDKSIKLGHLSIAELLHFALDVCDAMIYLSSRCYIHR